MERTSPGRGLSGWARHAVVAAVGLVLMTVVAAVGMAPADAAAITGIKGRVFDASGAPVNGVDSDLYRARSDGSRGRYVTETVTSDGYWWFGPADGCYVITLTAPAGTTFPGGQRYLNQRACVRQGQTPALLTATVTRDGATTTTTSAPATTTTTARPTTTTTAPATTTTGGAGACTPGQPIWKPVFEDQFTGDGAAIGPQWRQYNSAGNAGFGLRRSSALSLWGGSLNIRASMENGVLVSGGLNHTLSQTYGRYEFRVRTDKDASEATSGVILTWPLSNVHPRDGENNIYETLWAPGDRHEFYSFIHKPYGTIHDQDYTVHAADASQWHTMAMEWAPDKLVIYRDGVAVKTLVETSADLIPDNPHYFAMQLDAWKSSLPAPVWMQVDYVKVWSYGGTC